MSWTISASGTADQVKASVADQSKVVPTDKAEAASMSAAVALINAALADCGGPKVHVSVSASGDAYEHSQDKLTVTDMQLGPNQEPGWRVKLLGNKRSGVVVYVNSTIIG
jgi:hypothetical protein